MKIMYPIKPFSNVKSRALKKKRIKSGSAQGADLKKIGWLRREDVSEFAMRQCAAVYA